MSSIRLLLILALWFTRIDNADASAKHYGAIVAVPDGLSPRYYLGAFPDPALLKRQSGDCGTDQHSCLDVGGSVCCTNSQYCITGPDFIASCCAIGSLCGNLCDASHYQCPYTTSISGSVTTLATCCSRGCPSTSAFKCASQYGGGCCSFDSTCASGGACIGTITSSSSKAVVSEAPSGCKTSQISCASSLGGGCCDVGLSCTVVSNTDYCASNTAMASRTASANINSTSSSSPLSTGAKAGIGAGIAVGALLIIGALLCFCISKRRAARTSSSAPAMMEGSASGTGERQNSDYFGPALGVGPWTDDERHLHPAASPSRGVPKEPHGPEDIAVPVEIDGRMSNGVPSPYKGGLEAHTPIELP